MPRSNRRCGGMAATISRVESRSPSSSRNRGQRRPDGPIAASRFGYPSPTTARGATQRIEQRSRESRRSQSGFEIAHKVRAELQTVHLPRERRHFGASGGWRPRRGCRDRGARMRRRSTADCPSSEGWVLAERGFIGSSRPKATRHIARGALDSAPENAKLNRRPTGFTAGESCERCVRTTQAGSFRDAAAHPAQDGGLSSPGAGPINEPSPFIDPRRRLCADVQRPECQEASGGLASRPGPGIKLPFHIRISSNSARRLSEYASSDAASSARWPRGCGPLRPPGVRRATPRGKSGPTRLGCIPTAPARPAAAPGHRKRLDDNRAMPPTPNGTCASRSVAASASTMPCTSARASVAPRSMLRSFSPMCTSSMGPEARQSAKPLGSQPGLDEQADPAAPVDDRQNAVDLGEEKYGNMMTTRTDDAGEPGRSLRTSSSATGSPSVPYRAWQSPA